MESILNSIFNEKGITKIIMDYEKEMREYETFSNTLRDIRNNMDFDIAEGDGAISMLSLLEFYTNEKNKKLVKTIDITNDINVYKDFIKYLTLLIMEIITFNGLYNMGNIEMVFPSFDLICNTWQQNITDQAKLDKLAMYRESRQKAINYLEILENY